MKFWRFQKWGKTDFGRGPMRVVMHSPVLAFFGACNCARCFLGRFR